MTPMSPHYITARCSSLVSYSSILEMAYPSYPLHTELAIAISSATTQRLQEVLHEILDHPEEARSIAVAKLLVPVEKVQKSFEEQLPGVFEVNGIDESFDGNFDSLVHEELSKYTDVTEATSTKQDLDASPEEDDNDELKDSEDAPNKKPSHVRRWYHCGLCDQEYDILDNNMGDCVWHDGEHNLQLC